MTRVLARETFPGEVRLAHQITTSVGGTTSLLLSQQNRFYISLIVVSKLWGAHNSDHEAACTIREA